MAFTTTEIEVKARALGKAAARGDPSSTVLSLIDELRRGVSATADMLRTTKVGMSVGRLRQHKDPIVARQATELVNKWRNDIAKRPNGSGSSTPKKAEGGVNVDKWRSSVALEKRNTKTDGVNTSGTTESETRNSCIKLMYDGLVFMAEEGTFRPHFQLSFSPPQ
jgi:transcription elongation factor S-II